MKAIACSVTRGSRPPAAASRAETQPASSQRGGGPSPAGNAARRTRPASQIAPEASHAVSAIVPPGRVARAISAAARAGSGAKITPKQLTVASKAPSGTGRAPASPTRNSARTPAAAARPRACATRAGEASTPVASAPRAIAARATLPVPQATSSRRAPGGGATASSSTSAAGSRVAAMRA